MQHRTNSDAITTRRLNAGLTKLQLAAAAGISRQMVSAIEHGTRQGSPEALLAIADVLGCSVMDLLEEVAA